MSLILHLRPTRVPARALRFTHTFGLGGIALVLFGLLLVLTVTGIGFRGPGMSLVWPWQI